MSKLHVDRIGITLNRLFKDQIDLSDIENNAAKEKDDAFLSRSLAAYVLTQTAKIDNKSAAESVVDGYGDNGIDAIYFDKDELSVYVVQSKWKHSGKGSPDLGSVRNFIAGFKDLINGEFDRFNKKVAKMKDSISDALDNAQVKFILIIAYTGTDPLSDDADRAIQDLLGDINDPTELVTISIFRLNELYKAVAGQAEGAPIRLEILLRDWGQIDEPYLSYYGQVDAIDVATWWHDYAERLFTPNLRKFLGSTDVNDAIMETLKKNPESFWYFNNGITIICNSIKLKPIGRGSKKSNVFECDGASVVNGAQTVGCIARAYFIIPDQVRKAHVLAKFISLENCPERFAFDITRAANTQNRIDRRDFVSLDEEQKRLEVDLLLVCSKKYVYKRGEEKPTPEIGCDFEEAAIALACAQPDVELAVQAKREVSKLWDDIERPPYTILFNSALSPSKLWRVVEILRIVDSMIKEEQSKREGRDRLIAIHGNRFVLNRVFRILPTDKFDDIDLDVDKVKQEASSETALILDALTQIVNENYSNSYPANLFKNKSKCVEIAQLLERGGDDLPE